MSPALAPHLEVCRIHGPLRRRRHQAFGETPVALMSPALAPSPETCRLHRPCRRRGHQAIGGNPSCTDVAGIWSALPACMLLHALCCVAMVGLHAAPAILWLLDHIQRVVRALMIAARLAAHILSVCSCESTVVSSSTTHLPWRKGFFKCSYSHGFLHGGALNQPSCSITPLLITISLK